MQTVVLEPSTNTHTISAENIVVTDLGNSELFLEITGNGIVSHGEHAPAVTESQYVVKYVQQELNPITNELQNAFD